QALGRAVPGQVGRSPGRAAPHREHHRGEAQPGRHLAVSPPRFRQRRPRRVQAGAGPPALPAAPRDRRLPHQPPARPVDRASGHRAPLPGVRHRRPPAAGQRDPPHPGDDRDDPARRRDGAGRAILVDTGARAGAHRRVRDRQRGRGGDLEAVPHRRAADPGRRAAHGVPGERHAAVRLPHQQHRSLVRRQREGLRRPARALLHGQHHGVRRRPRRPQQGAHLPPPLPEVLPPDGPPPAPPARGGGARGAHPRDRAVRPPARGGGDRGAVVAARSRPRVHRWPHRGARPRGGARVPVTTRTCPTCERPLDPMHAPVARVRGARIVTYCSVACAEGARPVAPPAAAPAPEPAPARRKEKGGRDRSAAPPGTQPAPAAPARAAPAPAPAASPPRPAPPPAAAPSAPPVAAPTAALAPAASASPAAAAAAAPSARTEPRPSTAPDLLVPETRAGRPRGALFAVCGLLVAAGVGFIGVELPRRADAAGPAPPPPRPAPEPATAAGPPEPPAPAGPAAPTPQQTHERAAAELRALTESTSPRVRRLAAQALARTGDARALELLRALHKEEPSQLGRIQIAYALARAGDTAARDALRAELTADRRDVRLDAARSLVQLGDDSGRKALRAMLNVRSHRIGAAGLLARLSDEEGVKVLRAEIAGKDSPESVMRAAVALGRAGDSSVRDRLREILEDRRYNVGAADALAALGDQSAAPALTAQLRLSAVRVQAALWLRRLGAEVDLAPLTLALESGDDATRVTAAEALLILTGPESLATHD